MITPADIQNKDFSKSFRGYEEEEVDMFLDLITLDLEKLMKENLNLKAQIATLTTEKDSIGGTDLTTKETLETAKKLMDDLAVSSEKRAKALIENAEMDAAIIIKDAKMKAEQMTDESAELARNFGNFKKEYKEILERYSREFENDISNVSVDKLSMLINERNQNKAEKAALENMTVEEIIKKDTEANFDDKKTMVNIKYD